ncbi:hypothetical protein PV325_003758 [Microctonus aethiopoides]|nr:hypothetical protein PV325_003758 [Microctonus aethiopoides]
MPNFARFKIGIETLIESQSIRQGVKGQDADELNIPGVATEATTDIGGMLSVAIFITRKDEKICVEMQDDKERENGIEVPVHFTANQIVQH